MVTKVTPELQQILEQQGINPNSPELLNQLKNPAIKTAEEAYNDARLNAPYFSADQVAINANASSDRSPSNISVAGKYGSVVNREENFVQERRDEVKEDALEVDPNASASPRPSPENQATRKEEEELEAKRHYQSPTPFKMEPSPFN